jgi:hypothetical protein
LEKYILTQGNLGVQVKADLERSGWTLITFDFFLTERRRGARATLEEGVGR